MAAHPNAAWLEVVDAAAREGDDIPRLSMEMAWEQFRIALEEPILNE